LSVAIPAIQPRLRLSGTNRLRSAFHGGQRLRFKSLRESTLKTARAWAIKELAISLWHYVSKTWAQKGWDRWLSWAVRSYLDPIKEVAKTIKAHLCGILNAVVLKVSNDPAEGLNSRIKMIKFRSRVFRNKERFANAIYFHFGGLALYPEGVVR
ncbi:MAG: transposase, partial [Candidatus Thiodiazotropha sp. (ex Lucinoma aequizonata)]|nr:transposase [Candidatus Thiodiazotropha sp. (ex Lucinoma aequizonata)]MCU7895950.1 transposase [Candidatus Thiodiazotropha sp. (ex Lucinoma aequizonata)]MCU7904166.1 transposase [Candidatus Thiodiazotropha sp. (ex Lucinoma aequizonata)]MCU7910335.1 transposase [Candidatus Thiodiazotropha sp. (ex Lucinoma aequizonata)]MCU7912362.1 transposase [Candidatus Thiodiazotropha sp. (ex Lucinoma aequizonata)]